MAVGFFPARRQNALVLAGLAQSKHVDPIDGDSRIDTQLHEARDGAGTPVSGKGRSLGVPARAWIAVGAAALLWVAVASVLALIS